MFTHMFIHMFTQMFTHMLIHMFTQMFKHMFTDVNTHVYTHCTHMFSQITVIIVTVVQMGIMGISQSSGLSFFCPINGPELLD
jgi:hypothetical protein